MGLGLSAPEVIGVSVSTERWALFVSVLKDLLKSKPSK